MHLTQMFPKKTLDALDLQAYSPTGAVVTIESIDYKTLDSKQFGEPEIAYFMKVREFKKPFKLNKTNAYSIAQLLGSEDTRTWVGQVIRLMPVRMSLTDRATGKPITIMTFGVDLLRPHEAPVLLPNTDITGMAYDSSRQLPGHQQRAPLPQGGAGAAMGELTPIGADKAGDVAVTLSERGRSLADFTTHLGNIGLSALIENKLPPAWPQAVLPVARKFCAQLPKCAAPMAPSAVNAMKAQWSAAAAAGATEVIDPKTGEVTQAAAAPPGPHALGRAPELTLAGDGQLPAQKPQAGAGYQEINEDDIPF